MQTISDSKRLHNVIQQWHQQGFKVALVATMGNLHQGHIELIKQARQYADKVVASIFVNPLQFGQHEDLARYPRTLSDDQRALYHADCDLLFHPSVSLIYPNGTAAQTRIDVPSLSHILCGHSRPGHFQGVATVVAKLLHLVQPDVALFGQKDYQQLMVIRAMVRDLNMAVEIIGMDTVREADGLAKSSRNGYLDANERLIAPQLKHTLDALALQVQQHGLAARQQLEEKAMARLNQLGFTSDYVAICQAESLQPAQTADRQLVLLAAAYLGQTRLIDNLTVDLDHTFATMAR